MANMKNYLFLATVFFFQMSIALADDTANDKFFSSEDEIIVWAIEAVTETMTYDFQNYEERMKHNSSFFTENGWEAYSQAVQKAQMKEMVVQRELYLVTYKSDSENAEVCNKDEEAGLNIWSVVVPIRTIYSSTTENKITRQFVFVLIKETMDGEKTTTKKAIDRWMGGAGVGLEKTCQWYEEIKSFDKDLNDYTILKEGLDNFYKNLFDHSVKKAKEGDADAMLALARAFHSGLGVEINKETSLMWLKLSAEEKNEDAQYFLGLKFDTGEDVEENDETAVLWYTKAAKKGQPSAQAMLATKYYAGKGGLPVDDIESYAWAYVASKNPKISGANEKIMIDFQAKPAKELGSEKLSLAKAKAVEYYKLYVEPYN